jgi:hypothetical protein
VATAIEAWTENPYGALKKLTRYDTKKEQTLKKKTVYRK